MMHSLARGVGLFMIISVWHDHSCIGQLPAPQLENALIRNPMLRAPLAEHANQLNIRSTLPRSIWCSYFFCHVVIFGQQLSCWNLNLMLATGLHLWFWGLCKIHKLQAQHRQATVRVRLRRQAVLLQMLPQK